MLGSLSWLLEKKGLAAVDRKDRAGDGPGRSEKNNRARDVFGIDGAFERERIGNMFHARGAEFARRKDRAGRDGVDSDVRRKLAGEFERVAAKRGFCGFVRRRRNGTGQRRGVQNADGGELAFTRAHAGEKADEFAGREMVHRLLSVEFGLRSVPADPHRGVVHKTIDRADGIRHASHGVEIGEIAGNDFMAERRGGGGQ